MKFKIEILTKAVWKITLRKTIITQIMKTLSGIHQKIHRMLEKAGIRPSPARILTLKTLMESNRPLSGLEIENALESIDRSTITRTLSILNEEHLIHAIADGSGSMKYEICIADNELDQHNDQHAHFHCRVCGNTICLREVEIPEFKLEDGYKQETLTFVITGVCPNCSI